MEFEEKRNKINEVFKILREKGINAKKHNQNAWKNIQEHENAISYTHYDVEAMKSSDVINFMWKGDGEKIFNILKENFQNVKWDGTIFSTMRVKF